MAHQAPRYFIDFGTGYPLKIDVDIGKSSGRIAARERAKKQYPRSSESRTEMVGDFLCNFNRWQV